MGRTSIPFTEADQVGSHFDLPEAPNTVHFEVRTAGRLDRVRMRDAVRTALDAHPRYRAKRQAVRRFATGYRWELPDRPDLDPYSYQECPELDGTAAETLRAALFDRSPPLAMSPPLRVLHIGTPSGDAVLFCAHHSSLDGHSLAGFAERVAEFYQGGQPSSSRLSSGRSSSASRAVQREAEPVSSAVRATRLAHPARVVPSGGSGSAGYGFAFLDLARTEVRPDCARGIGTVNDFLAAALATAIDRWNAAHGGSVGAAGPVVLTVPIADRAHAVVNPGNVSRLVQVRMLRQPGDAAVVPVGRTEAARVLAAVTTQIDHGRGNSSEQGIVGRFLGSPVVPVALKRGVIRPLTRLAARRTPTALLSNLGPLPELSFGAESDAFVTAAYFSAPIRMPRGLCAGVVGHRDRLHICLRHNTALFSRSAAAAFADGYREAIREWAKAVG